MRTIVLICLACLCLPAAAAEMYKWTDEKGRVHYSDKPPPEGTKAEERDLPETADSAPTQLPERAPPPSAECLAARQSLSQLQQNSNVAMDLDGDGKPETLDEAARQAQIASIQGQLEGLCAPPKPKPSPEAGAPPAEDDPAEEDGAGA